MTLRSPWLALHLALLTLAAGLLAWLLLPNARVLELMSEEGPIETATAWLYFAGAAAIGALAHRGTPLGTRLSLVAVAIAFGLRELDLHNALTGTSVLRVSYYYSDAPAAHRLPAAAVLLLLAAAAITLLRRYAKAVWSGARAGRPMEATIVVFVVTIVAAKALDRSLNAMTEWFGVVWSPWLFALQAAIEEPLELALPLQLLLALAQHRLAAQSDEKAVSTPV